MTSEQTCFVNLMGGVNFTKKKIGRRLLKEFPTKQKCEFRKYRRSGRSRRDKPSKVEDKLVVEFDESSGDRGARGAPTAKQLELLSGGLEEPWDPSSASTKPPDR